MKGNADRRVADEVLTAERAINQYIVHSECVRLGIPKRLAEVERKQAIDG